MTNIFELHHIWRMCVASTQVNNTFYVPSNVPIQSSTLKLYVKWEQRVQIS